jgi:hypothetical protein
METIKEKSRKNLERNVNYIDAQIKYLELNKHSNDSNFICVSRNHLQTAQMSLSGKVSLISCLHPMQFSQLMAEAVCQELNEKGYQVTVISPLDYYEKRRSELKKQINNI